MTPNTPSTTDSTANLTANATVEATADELEVKAELPPVPLLLEYPDGIGDLVASTVAVMSMLKQVRAPIVFDVRAVHKDAECVFDNWPQKVKFETGASVKKIVMTNAQVKVSNYAPVTYAHSYCFTLSKALGIRIDPCFRYPFIFLSDAEKATVPEVIAKSDKPVWLINGGNIGFTVKRWNHWQKVVDTLKRRINFVQIGGPGDHRPLGGVHANLVGKTSIRELINLCYHCHGGMGPESNLHHLLAAFQKPAVTVCSGSWPLNFFAYPSGRYLHRLGCYPCCATEACGRLRVLPLGDGHHADKALCVLPVTSGDHPATAKCMDDISYIEVVKAVEDYYLGGVLQW